MVCAPSTKFSPSNAAGKKRVDFVQSPEPENRMTGGHHAADFPPYAPCISDGTGASCPPLGLALSDSDAPLQQDSSEYRKRMAPDADTGYGNERYARPDGRPARFAATGWARCGTAVSNIIGFASRPGAEVCPGDPRLLGVQDGRPSAQRAANREQAGHRFRHGLP